MAGSDRSPTARLLERLSRLEDRHRETGFDALRTEVLEGKSDAWSRFVEKYSRFAYTLALRLTRGAVEREDIASRIYTRTFERLQNDDYRLLRNFGGRSRFTTYLYRIVQTERKSFFEQARRQPLFHAASLDVGNGEEPVMPAGEAPALKPAALRGLVTRALHGLEPGQRLLLACRYRDGLKLRELAELFGLKDTNAAARAVYAALERFDPLRALVRADHLEKADREALAGAIREELFQLRQTAEGDA